jgi:hypothetical protein
LEPSCSIVIGERLCPFAPPVRSPPQLKLRASVATSLDEVIEEVAQEAAALRAGIDSPAALVAQTTLLVLDGTSP